MRLIDADKLLEETRKDRDYARKNGFLDMYCERQTLIDRIEAQPTAYDLDEVVEQLEEFRDEMKMFGCDGLLSHLDNIINSNYTQIGVAYSNGY